MNYKITSGLNFWDGILSAEQIKAKTRCESKI